MSDNVVPMPKLREFELDRANAPRRALRVHSEAYGCPTSRRYPRSRAEAFPDERAQWATRYVRPRSRVVPALVYLAALVAVWVMLR